MQSDELVQHGQQGADIFPYDPFEDQPVADNDNAQLPETPNGGTQHQEPTDAPVQDNWKVRAGYFQSQHDQLRNQVNPYLPLISHLEQNPQALEAVIGVLTNQPAQNAAPAEVIPQEPVKPSDYNDQEAYSDPDSSSFKYRIEREKYLAEKVEFLSKKTAEREQMIQQQIEAQRQRQEQHQMLSQTHGILTTQFGMANDEAAEFIRDMSSENSISFQNLVGYWRYTKQQQAQASGGQKRMPARQNAPQQPYYQYPPAGINGGGNNRQRPMTPDEIFNRETFGV